MAEIREDDLRTVLHTIDALRSFESRVEDIFFQGSLTLVHRNGYVIGDVLADGEQWVFDPEAYGSEMS